MRKEVLRLSNISVENYKTGGIYEVSFSLFDSEILGLAGRATSGIKTLLKLFRGLLPEYEGELTKLGKPVSLHQPKDSKDNRIAVLGGTPVVFPDLGIIENIELGGDIPSLFARVNNMKIEEEVGDLITEFGFRDDRRRLKELSPYEKKKVEILKALYGQVSVLIFSEIEVWCNEKEAEDFAAILELLKARRVAIILEYDSRFPSFAHLVQRCITIVCGYCSTTVFAQKDAPIFCGHISRILLGEVADQDDNGNKTEKIAFEELSLTLAGKSGVQLLSDTSSITGFFDSKGVIPRNLKMFFHYLNSNVDVTLNGNKLVIADIPDALRERIAFISGDNQYTNSSIFQNLSPAANACIFLNQVWSKRLRYNESVEKYLLKAIAKEYEILKELEEDCDQTDCYHVSTEREYQLAIARWLIINPKIVVMFAPFGNNDMAGRTKYTNLQKELANKGKRIFVISSNRLDLMACDKIITL